MISVTAFMTQSAVIWSDTNSNHAKGILFLNYSELSSLQNISVPEACGKATATNNGMNLIILVMKAPKKPNNWREQVAEPTKYYFSF